MTIDYMTDPNLSSTDIDNLMEDERFPHKFELLSHPNTSQEYHYIFYSQEHTKEQVFRSGRVPEKLRKHILNNNFKDSLLMLSYIPKIEKQEFKDFINHHYYNNYEEIIPYINQYIQNDIELYKDILWFLKRYESRYLVNLISDGYKNIQYTKEMNILIIDEVISYLMKRESKLNINVFYLKFQKSLDKDIIKKMLTVGDLNTAPNQVHLLFAFLKQEKMMMDNDIELLFRNNPNHNIKLGYFISTTDDEYVLQNINMDDHEMRKALFMKNNFSSSILNQVIEMLNGIEKTALLIYNNQKSINEETWSIIFKKIKSIHELEVQDKDEAKSSIHYSFINALVDFSNTQVNANAQSYHRIINKHIDKHIKIPSNILYNMELLTNKYVDDRRKSILIQKIKKHPNYENVAKTVIDVINSQN